MLVKLQFHFFYYLVIVDSLKEKESKSERRMPWLPRPMKDVVSCDKPRGFANRN